MKTNEDLHEMKMYRDGLCIALGLRPDELLGNSRKQPRPLVRQITSTMLENRYYPGLCMQEIGFHLMGYSFKSAHSMMIHNKGAINNWVESKNKQAIELLATAQAYDDSYAKRRAKDNHRRAQKVVESSAWDKVDAQTSAKEYAGINYKPDAGAAVRGQKARARIVVGVYAVNLMSMVLLAGMVLQIVIKS